MENIAISIPAGAGQPSLWMSLAAPLATFIAALFVLGGDRIRSLLFKPKLTLSLVDARGQSVPMHVTRSDKSAIEVIGARWYHGRVSNAARGRWPAATDVRVYLVEVKKLKNRRYNVIWDGEAPLTLKHEQIFNPRRTVGPAMTADLISATANGLLRFNVVGIPNNAELVYKGGAWLKAKFVANSIEVDSEPLYLGIKWDGHWDDADDEMLRHLPIEVLSQEQYDDDEFRADVPAS